MAAPSLHIDTAGGRLAAEPGSVVTVGRHSGSTLAIEDPRVSRRHLRVHVVDDRWVVEDAGSSNGTYVNGHRLGRFSVVETTTVRLGDPREGPWLRLSPAAASEGDEQETLEERPPERVTIGRSPESDLVLDDLLVSRHHAELRRRADGRYELVDLGSFNGTFVNGRRIAEPTVLGERDLVGIGRSQFRVAGSRLVETVEPAGIGFAAVGLEVETDAGTTLLDGVGFALAHGALFAVVGPSGAGKSTLLGALTGLRPAERGTVYFDGRNLYEEYEHLRQRIGYVPQDDVVHPELTVAQSLEYAAELRFAPDVTAAERRARVEEVMAELDLTARRDLPVRKLSGGQRKRVSVALELLTKPTLLFLDEPTSGLDPGLERSLMEHLRRLADGGRIVVVVTHSVDSLNLCDRALFLAPGGRTAFFGPPQLAIAYFERADYQEVFRHLGDGDPEAAKARFASHELARRYLHEPLAGYAAGRRAPTAVPAAARRQSWARQLWILTRRYARVLAGDRVNLAVLAGSAPVLGLVTLWRLPGDELSALPPTQVRLTSQAALVLFVVVLGMTLLGLANGIREIVKELPVLRRERAVGLSLSAYVVSKALVLGALTALQAAIFVPIALALQNGPEDAVLLGWPLGELMVAAAAAGIAAMALALLVSALANSTSTAVAVLPILVVVQLLLASGGVFPGKADRPLLRELGYASSTSWGFAASASTSELNRLQALSAVAAQVPTVDVERPAEVPAALLEAGRGEPLWNHEPGAWLRAIVALGAITLACLALAWAALRRFDPL